MNIKRMFTQYNHDVLSGKKNKYIVIHWVGAASSAENNGKYFQGGDRGASAHYFVDDDSVVQVVSEKDAAWAVGSSGLLDQGSPYAKYGAKYFGKCTNSNSISIEMCCKKSEAGNLYISKKTLERTAKLVQGIQKRHKIDNAHVIRHFDVNGKVCPLPYIEQSKWEDVHALLTGQKFKIRAKGKLIVRKTDKLTSRRIDLLEKGKTYQIVRTNKKGNRGKLKSGGWITITEKYIEKSNA